MSCEISQTDLCWMRGDTQTLVITYQNSDGEVIDITGYSAKSQLRAKAGDYESPPLAEITEADGIVVDGPAGKLTLTFDDAITGVALDGLKKVVWDVEITSPAGVVTTLAIGSITLVNDVTR